MNQSKAILTPKEGSVPQEDERSEMAMSEAVPIEEENKTKNAKHVELELYDLDIPIGWRKGVRSCTKYSISNHLVYSRLSPNFRAFTARVDEVQIPRNINETLQIPNWERAVIEEMEALEKNDTWEVVSLPQNKKVVGSKWMFTIKHKFDGSIERYKASLVTQGFTQTHGIDYEETFAPVQSLILYVYYYLLQLI